MNLLPSSQCTHGRYSVVTDHDTGEMVCTACGSVVGIDEELAVYTGPVMQDDKHGGDSALVQMLYNTGPASTLTRHDYTSPTSVMIGTENKDRNGIPVSAKVADVMKRIRLWDNRIKYRYGSNRTMISALALLESISTKLALPPHVHEKTAYIYRKASKNGLLHGRSSAHAIAAATYISTREAAMPVSMSDIVLATCGEVKNNKLLKCISHTYRLVLTELDIKVPKLDPSKLIARFTAKLDLGEAITRAATSNARIVSTSSIAVGKNPLVIAAAVIYITAKIHTRHVNQEAIAAAVGITSLSLRNMCKRIYEEKLNEKFV